MEFLSNIVTEITAPNTVPFQPGNDIIGFGGDIPSELLAVGIDAAIVCYTTDWDETATTPRIKYYAIASNNGVLGIVAVGSANPSTTPASILAAWQFVGRANTTLQALFQLYGDSSLSNPLLTMRTLGTGSGEGILLDMKASNATPAATAGRGRLYVSSTGQLVYQGPTTSTVIAPA